MIYKKRGVKEPKKLEFPTSSQNTIFKILANLDYLQSPFSDKTLGGYSISETVYHPQKNSFSIAIRTKEYKFWAIFHNAIDDCKFNYIEPIEVLLFYNKGQGFDEKNDRAA